MARRQGLTVGRRAGAARSPTAAPPPLAVTDAPFLAAAGAIARTLADTAMTTGAGAGWQGDELVGDSEATLAVVRGAVGPGLYSGLAGIGWFLGHLAAVTSDRRLEALAVAALRSAIAQASSDGTATLSLFSGRTGVAWAAVDVGTRLPDAGLARDGLALARLVATSVLPGDRAEPERSDPSRDGDVDLLAGLAGTVVGLLAIHELLRQASVRSPTSADDGLLDAASRAAHVLGETAQRDAFGASWPDPACPDAPALCGLGHGASGPAWAIAEAAWATGVTGASGLPPVVEQALRYERGWFSADRCAWADLREPPVHGARGDWPAWTSAWCHGAFGIGAVRWRIHERTGDLTALAEASAAVDAARAFVTSAARALRSGGCGDVTLCHGLGGAIELMLLAYEITGEADHLRAARRAGELVLATRAANQGRWTLGLRRAELVPGLFTGLAGIGVTMLRLHDPAAIASPLLPGRRRWPGRRPRA